MAWDGIKDYGFGGKHRTKEKDDEYRSRIKGVPRKRVWTKSKCVEELEDILKSLKKILREQEKVDTKTPVKAKREMIRDLNTMMSRILDFLRYLYPQVETKVNLNIDTTADAVIERIQTYKENRKNENVFLVGIDKDE